MQSIHIEDRKKINLVGATKIISSTSTQAVVEMEDTTLIIQGTSLEITKLNLENHEVTFVGEFASAKYVNKAEKKGLFKRIFK